MSMHKIPLTPLELDGLTKHGLDVGTPSQLSDVFRQGVAWGQAAALKASESAAVLTDEHIKQYMAPWLVYPSDPDDEADLLSNVRAMLAAAPQPPAPASEKQDMEAAIAILINTATFGSEPLYADGSDTPNRMLQLKSAKFLHGLISSEPFEEKHKWLLGQKVSMPTESAKPLPLTNEQIGKLCPYRVLSNNANVWKNGFHAAAELALSQPEQALRQIAEFGELQNARAEQEPEYWQWRRKVEKWSISGIFNNEVFATTDDSEVRRLYTAPPALDKLDAYLAANYPDVKGDTVTERAINALERMDIEAGIVDIPARELSDAEIGPMVRVALFKHMNNASAASKNACIEVVYEVAHAVLAAVQPAPQAPSQYSEADCLASEVRWAGKEPQLIGCVQHDCTECRARMAVPQAREVTDAATMLLAAVKQVQIDIAESNEIMADTAVLVDAAIAKATWMAS